MIDYKNDQILSDHSDLGDWLVILSLHSKWYKIVLIYWNSTNKKTIIDWSIKRSLDQYIRALIVVHLKVDAHFLNKQIFQMFFVIKRWYKHLFSNLV